MVDKVLVANRGEIAIRVMRSLREMGVATVAVYSDADVNAPHVRYADESVRLGPGPSADSYLSMERVLQACEQTGADAVHPGYGFLSERAVFAQACEDAGVIFIGPRADAIDAMGHKTRARRLMESAGVPVVPGAHIDELDNLAAKAETLGYPVMLKAAAGGGGKGMRLVECEGDLLGAFERATSEAKGAFGDDTVYMEKAIVNPRHVEIQVLADDHGQCVHLYERDCSLQRRHQKVVEETPSPAPQVTDDLVRRMGEVAVRAARAVNYRSAGTVEFLVDGDGAFYFLEMNTRLQVEHPITEWVTQVDLVRAQVRVAMGEPLPFAQGDLARHGHAMECRVYAEDASRNFMPSPGRILSMLEPAGPGVRVDSGVVAGTEVSTLYDPMLSKLSVWAPTRGEAIARMKRALSEYVITGITTNLDFHRRVMDEPDFVTGRYTTAYLEEHSHLTGDHPWNEATSDAVAAAAALRAHGGEMGVPPADPARAVRFSAWQRASMPKS